MPLLHTEIEINAPRLRVWQVLTQKDRWMYWNTFLYDQDVRRPLVEGQSICLAVRRVAGETETEFQPTVTLVQPETCLKWVTVIPGFVSEHGFELQDIGGNPGRDNRVGDRTKYIHQETFSGTLTRLFLPFIRQEEQQGMRRMAKELKEYAERQKNQR